jgi:uncharacterized RDD family membrane protein YckC
MDDPLDTDAIVEAPEHIVFRYVVAGPGRRAVAQLIDLCVCYGGLLFLSIFVMLAFAGFEAIAGWKSPFFGSFADAGVGVILVIAFAAQWLYSFLWEGFTGRSPGKIALGLRVVMVSGQPIGFGAAALRNVLRAADILPATYLVGVVAMALNRRFQRIGDLVAGTMVIVAGRPSKAGPLMLWPPPERVELAVLPPEVPLDFDERQAIELFLRRRAALGPARAHELASIMMEPLRRRFGFRLPDPSRTLALLYDRAVNVGRSESPPSSRGAASMWPPPRPPEERRP